jgi:Polysaccharide pyruvyl transferase
MNGQCIIKSISNLKAESITFGCVLPRGANIGDDIQAIAAAQFFPGNTIYIDREFLGSFQYKHPLPTVINGWFMYTARSGWVDERPAPDRSWPPNACVDPLLISIHLTPDFVSEAMSDEGINFFRSHGPVGARDTFTQRVLEERGIPSYFSGCLTLTLANPYKNESRNDNVIYVVDLPAEVEKVIRRRCKTPVVRLKHYEKEINISSVDQKLLSRAEIILDEYRRAKCVITSRLHAAMPCLAFETPVVLVHKDPYSDSRMGGLIELVRHCSPRDVLKGRLPIDPDAPTPNSSSYLKLQSQLITTVKDWIKKKTSNLSTVKGT